MVSPYDYARLLEELASAPAQCEAHVILRQFRLLWGEGALSEQQVEQVTDIINERPE